MNSLYKILPVLFICITACSNETAPVVWVPDTPIGDPPEQSQFTNALSILNDVQQMRSFIVAKDDSIIAEHYFNDTSGDDLYDVRSVTKSITSILIGIAIDKEYIQSVDETIDTYLSDYYNSFTDGKENITIKHLLTMSSGLDWPPIGDWSELSSWRRSANPVEYVLSKDLVHTPGTYFNYSDGASHLLSVILTEATGTGTNLFAAINLFAPLDLEQIRTWSTDNLGINFGNYALYLTPREMLKIGQLLLNNGSFNGEQVVSPEWITESTGHEMFVGGICEASYYGYLFWIGSVVSHDYYFANGYGGQFIFVVPDLNAVIVATSDWSGVPQELADSNWNNIMNAIKNYTIPYIN